MNCVTDSGDLVRVCDDRKCAVGNFEGCVNPGFSPLPF